MLNDKWNLAANNALICAVLGWFLAQFLKLLFTAAREHRFSITFLWVSGGMPSSHAATVCALSMAMAFEKGLGSLEFAISFVLAFIVMYDALGVRRAAGEQAKVLNRIVAEFEAGHAVNFGKELKELIGHTPIQVYAGAFLGIAITVIWYLTFAK